MAAGRHQERLTVDDAATAAALAAHCLPEAWSAASFAPMLAEPGVSGWKVVQGEALAGFILLRQVAGEAEILTLVVDPRHRRQGIAKALLATALEALGETTAFLEVRAGNDAAVALYRQAGFTQVGLRRDYYASEAGREDAVVMRRG